MGLLQEMAGPSSTSRCTAVDGLISVAQTCRRRAAGQPGARAPARGAAAMRAIPVAAAQADAVERALGRGLQG